MESKQFNVRMPLFSHDEFASLRLELRRVGTKPSEGDLVAALIYSALLNVEAAKRAVEDFVVHELEKEAV